jgi:hypothetical protein
MKSFTIIAIIFILLSCGKTKSFMNTGVITGPDPRACACCGGYFFHFTNVSDTSNKQLVNAGIFQFPINVKYPVFVQVDWQNSTFCGGYAIKIINYRLL